MVLKIRDITTHMGYIWPYNLQCLHISYQFLWPCWFFWISWQLFFYRARSSSPRIIPRFGLRLFKPKCDVHWNVRGITVIFVDTPHKQLLQPPRTAFTPIWHWIQSCTSVVDYAYILVWRPCHFTLLVACEHQALYVQPASIAYRTRSDGSFSGGNEWNATFQYFQMSGPVGIRHFTRETHHFTHVHV